MSLHLYRASRLTQTRLVARPSNAPLRWVSSSAPKPSATTSAPTTATNTPKLGPLSATLTATYRDSKRRFGSLPKWQRLVLGAATGSAVVSALLLLRDDDPILARANPADRAYLSEIPLGKLLNGWWVYAFCARPTLVEASEALFLFFHSLPVIGPVVDSVVRHTFFRQFLAGENTDDALRVAWAPLREQGIGTLCGYNLEAKHDGSCVPADVLAAQITETKHAIEAVGKFGLGHVSPADVAAGDTRCWVRIKLTGLTPDPEVIQRASAAIMRARTGPQVHYPGVPQDGDSIALYSSDLSPKDRDSLRSLNGTLRDIMAHAQRFGVRVVIDAEQTWYQPAIDVYTEELMREFNGGKGPPIVCASFQAYLRRNSALIESQLARAQAGGYKLIFKQVRGAYHPYENARWASEGREGPPPVWSTKAETDQSYYDGMRLGIGAIKARLDDPDKQSPGGVVDVAAIWATHNEISVEEGFRLVEELGLGVPQVDGSLRLSSAAANRIAFAQLFGMKDNLTNRIAATLKADNGLPVVCKSVSYGEFEEAIPFLSRRAVENKTVMEGRGGAVSERRRLGREILRRVVPFYDYE